MNDNTTGDAGTGVESGGTVSDQVPESGEIAVAAPLMTVSEPRSIGENLGWTLGAGLAVGLVVGALLPRARRHKRPRTVRALADAVGELSHALATQAVARAESAADTIATKGGEKFDSVTRTIGKAIQDRSASVQQQAQQLADGAGDQLHSVSKALARKAVDWVEKTRS